MVFQKRLTDLLVWVTCYSLLRKRMLLHSHTHQAIKCKHAFFNTLRWSFEMIHVYKNPQGGGEGFTFWPTDYIACVCLSRESSDWDWMKFTRCERLLLVKAFFFVFVVFVGFSSLENYFGLRTTNVRVKTVHPSVWGGIKRFEHFQRGLYFPDNRAFDLWIDFVSSSSPSFAGLN